MDEPNRDKPTLVVGVGASAGGLAAYKELLLALPDRTGMAFIFVQHLDPRHKSLLAELLAPHTQLTVVEAEHQAVLAPDTVYVITPNTNLSIQDDRIELEASGPRHGVRLSVDHLLRSLAREYGPRAVGIVLSGAGNDGTAGLRAIKDEGGLTIAQSPASASQRGMPQSAVDASVVELVLEIPEMPAALERFERMPSSVRTALRAEPEAEPERTITLSETLLDRFVAVLRETRGLDASIYRVATLERRILRRMMLTGFENPERYLETVQTEPEQQVALHRDLLISVTEFFRDTEAFETLRETAVRPLVRQASPDDTLRVWIPGCATGEEAYSIAMEFLDEFDRQDQHPNLQIFATDVDRDALGVARNAVYPRSIAERVSSTRLDKYFIALEGRGYQVQPRLRGVVSFAEHDVCVDPPFSRTHLVSLRNVLIYLRPEAQRHVLRLLHFSLLPDCYLLLGTSESTSQQSELFTPLSTPWRLYRKLGSSRSLMPLSPTNRRSFTWPPPEREASGGQHRSRGDELARQLLMRTCVPPSLVVTRDGVVIFMHGELRPYLSFPQGSPTMQLTAMLDTRLLPRVQATMYRCRREGTLCTGTAPKDEPEGTGTKITAYPARDLGEGAVIVTFEPLAEPQVVATSSGTAATDGTSGQLVAQLEQELFATREDLRNTVEELESSNEELRSSNEESMSVNEELQSTNEELEATSEELRSLNEELSTVNAQLREKLQQLESAHDDLTNFFASTKIATVFLDDQLSIKRFTPAAEDMLRIDHDAEGHYVGNFARDMLQHDLAAKARSVLDQLVSQHDELHTPDGRWIARSILPYRTNRRRIEGVVVTLVDITPLRSTTETLAVREQQQAMLARLGLMALEDTDLQRFLDQVIREVQQTLHTDLCKVLELEPSGESLLLRAGVGWHEGLVGQASVDTGMDSQAGFTLHAQEPVIVDDLATERRFRGPALLREHGVVSGISCIIRGSDAPYGVLGAHTTEHRVFTHEDTNFMLGVATVVAAAVSRHQARVRRVLESACTTALSNPQGLVDAVEVIFDAFTRIVDTSVGELWQPDADGHLQRVRLLTTTSPRRRDVEAAFGGGYVEPDPSVVGQVFARRRAQWASTLGRSDQPPHLAAARSVGLRSALVLPIVSGAEVLGVVTLYTSRHLYAGPSLLRALESIGRTIGESVRRAAVEQQLRRLAAIAEAADDAIMGLDGSGVVTVWLPGAERLYGYTAAEMQGAQIERLVPPQHHAELRQMLARVRRGGLVEPTEWQVASKGGDIVHVSTRLSAIRDPSGHLIGISKIDRDITDRRRAAEALAESERRFRGTFDNAAVGIVHMAPGPDLLCRRINDRLLQILGYRREQLEGMPLATMVHPDDLPAYAERMGDLFARRITEDRDEQRYVCKNGDLVWVNVTASLARTSPDSPDYAILIVQDISDRKRTELQLQESEWRFRQILTGSPVPMMVCDEHGVVVAQSDSWSAMFGYSIEEATTLAQWAQRVYGERAPEIVVYLERLWSQGSTEPPPDIDARDREGRVRSLLLSGASLGPAEGRTLRICAAADVTAQKQAERELLEASRQKDEFLAMLGHELRNPLAAVHGAARLPSLSRTNDPELQEAHAILTRQTSHMTKLLDGLLDVSRIIRGKITLEEQMVELREVVQQVARDQQSQLEAKGLAFDHDLEGEALWVWGDPVRLAQVVDNLLSNAIKYTDEGSISMELGPEDEGVMLVVRDTGIGIEPELLPHIFDSFRQAQQSLHRSRGGLGLGLALVKSLVALHGGRCGARSEGSGKGTELWVWLPRSSPPSPEHRPPHLRSATTRILVVEDERDLAHVIRRLLEANGHEVRLTTLGREGIALASEWRPDIVLCDLGLPDGVSGYDVARALRADPRTQGIALAAVTGYGRPEDKAKARQAGFDAHVTKPVDLDDLEAVIDQLLGQRKAPAATDGEPPK